MISYRKDGRYWGPGTLCQPAVRCVLIQAAHPAEESAWHEVFDVVAILCDDDADLHPIIVSDGMFVSAHCLESKLSDLQLVACPWPREEDAARLAPIIKRMEASVRDRVNKEG